MQPSTTVSHPGVHCSLPAGKIQFIHYYKMKKKLVKNHLN